ncbi:MAG: hypothetical protein ACI9QC_000049 [Oceanicoccus sp.]|jgi:hypothetical protein
MSSPPPIGPSNKDTPEPAALIAREKTVDSLTAAINAARAITGAGDVHDLFNVIGPLADADVDTLAILVERLKTMNIVLEEGADLYSAQVALKDPQVAAQRDLGACLAQELRTLGVEASDIDGKSITELTARLTTEAALLMKKQADRTELDAKASKAFISSEQARRNDSLTLAMNAARSKEQDANLRLETNHQSAVTREEAAHYLKLAQEELPGALIQEGAYYKEIVTALERNVGLLTKFVIPGVTTLASGASGFYTYQAFANMKAVLGEDLGGLDPIALGGALIVNGSMWAIAIGLQLGVITMNPMPKRMDESGRMRRKLSPAAFAVMGAWLGFSAVSATSNIGGATALNATDQVVSGAWHDNDAKARQLIEDAGAVVIVDVDSTATIITEVQKEGRELVMEAKGLWTRPGSDIHYGFGPRSNAEMNQFIGRFEGAASEITGFGNCNGLIDLQSVGFWVADELEAENLANATFAPGVREFGHGPYDISQNITRCESSHPDRLAQLDALEVRLNEIGESINRGEILDTYAMNGTVRELNPILRELSQEAGVELVQLDELDPLAQEGALLSWKNAVRTYQLIQGTPIENAKRISWTLLVLSILMAMIDQVGAMGAGYSSYSKDRLLTGYIDHRNRLSNLNR